MNEQNCAIVVPSCDAYKDAWAPFFAFFFKYWPDCPFPVYLITDKEIYGDQRVKTIALGVDHGWANNMKIVLDQIPEKYFMYFLEDVFLTKKVDTNKILSFLELVKKNNIACLRLFPEPGPDNPYGENKELGVIAKDAPYRVSTMTAIWNKDSFIKLLKPGENAWQMELDGTKRSSEMDELFLSVWPTNYAIHYFATAIKKGYWVYDALELCKREGVPVVTSRRKESHFDYLTRRAAYLPLLGGFFRKARSLGKK